MSSLLSTRELMLWMQDETRQAGVKMFGPHRVQNFLSADPAVSPSYRHAGLF